VATVLLVEDDEEAAEPVSKALRLAGHRVLYVPNGHDALALLLLRDADVVVTDLRMPGFDGVTLVTVIRSYLRWQSLPIIVFSAYADDRARHTLAEAGVADVLVKGRDGPAELVEAVGRHLASRGDQANRN
jgi:CheY-like chemotaxis protein